MPVFSGVISQRRLGNLEVLRFLAASMVIFFHLQEKFAIELGLIPELNSTLGILGASGVDIFFVISGFVIALNIANPNTSPANFVGARFSRIIPTYWLLTLLAATLMFLVPSQFQHTTGAVEVLSSMAFLNTSFGIALPVISMGWTLNLEIFFYLIVACALILAGNYRYLTYLISCLWLFVAVIFFDADSLLIEFVFGFFAYWLWRVLPQSIAFGAILLFSSIALFGFWIAGATGHFERWLYFGIPALLLVLGSLLIPQNPSLFVKKLGFSSYSIYLTQWFSIPLCIFVIQAIALPQELIIFAFCLSLVFSVVVGVIYSEFVDRRLYLATRKILKL